MTTKLAKQVCVLEKKIDMLQGNLFRRVAELAKRVIRKFSNRPSGDDENFRYLHFSANLVCVLEKKIDMLQGNLFRRVAELATPFTAQHSNYTALLPLLSRRSFSLFTTPVKPAFSHGFTRDSPRHIPRIGSSVSPSELPISVENSAASTLSAALLKFDSFDFMRSSYSFAGMGFA